MGLWNKKVRDISYEPTDPGNEQRNVGWLLIQFGFQSFFGAAFETRMDFGNCSKKENPMDN